MSDREEGEPTPADDELSQSEQFLLTEAKRCREKALWWEAEARRILRALTGEDTRIIQRVTERALALRPDPANDPGHPPTDEELHTLHERMKAAARSSPPPTEETK